MTYKRTLAGGASRVAAAFLLSGLALAACKPGAPTNAAASNAASNDLAASNAADAPPPLAAIALAPGPATPLTPAPAASALPAAPPAPVATVANPSDAYAFADRASASNAGFGDAPPDYAFSYSGGEQPWVWRGDDQSMRVAEPLPGGGFRYYYYEPGATAPYLVRDPGYSYGYAGGALVVVYDSHGRPLPPGALGAQAEIAGRFLYRAQQIYAASQQQHEAVAEANWAARRSAVDAERAQWKADEASNQAWAAYHAAHQQTEDAHWDAERYRREAEAARFAQSIHDTKQAEHDLQAAQEAQARAAGGSSHYQGGPPPNGPPPAQGAPAGDARQAAKAAAHQAHLAAEQQAKAQNEQLTTQKAAAHQAHLTAEQQAKAAKLAAEKAKLDAGKTHATTPATTDPKAPKPKPKPKHDDAPGPNDRRPPDHS